MGHRCVVGMEIRSGSGGDDRGLLVHASESSHGVHGFPTGQNGQGNAVRLRSAQNGGAVKSGEAPERGENFGPEVRLIRSFLVFVGEGPPAADNHGQPFGLSGSSHV